MPIKPLSAQSAQLKKVAGLRHAQVRRKHGQQLVEGVQAVRELLAYAPELVRDVFTSDALLTAHADIAQLIAEHDSYGHVGDPAVIAKAAPSAQGIFAVADVPPVPELADLLAGARLVVLCVQVQDPGNLGTIIRTADAAGAAAVLLGSGSVDPTSEKVIRSAAGSTFHIPVLRAEVAPAVTAARQAGMQILAADGSGSAQLFQPGDALNLAAPTLWLAGNEARGFTREQLALADMRVRIPMWGKAESLNLAVATSLCLYASAAALAEV